MPVVWRVVWSWIMRIGGSWFIKRIIQWIIFQVAAFIFVYLTHDLLEAICYQTANAIRRGNSKIMVAVYRFENVAWRVYHAVYGKVTEMIAALRGKVDDVLGAIDPQTFALYLRMIEFATWLDATVGEIVQAGAATVTALVDEALQPVIERLDVAQARLDAIMDRLAALRADLEAQAAAFNEKVAAAFQKIVDRATAYQDRARAVVDERVASINQRLDGLFAAIERMHDMFDQAIIDIHAKVDGIEARCAVHDAGLITGRAEVMDWVRTQFWTDDGEFQPMTEEDQAALFLDELRGRVNAACRPLGDPGFGGIDWASYRWVQSFHRSDYEFSISLPELDLEGLDPPELSLDLIKLDQAEQGLHTLAADLTAISDALYMAGTQAGQRFLSVFPEVMRGGLEAHVKDLLMLILVKAFLERKGLLFEAIDAKMKSVDASMEEKKQELIDGAKAIANEIKEIEARAIEALPEHYKTTLEKAYEDIHGKIKEAGDQVQTVNIDEFVPDVGEIDHIVEQFPADIKARNAPNITDSVEFTIQDIYRILCNNFWRSERIALIICLAAQDLQVDEGELKQWLEELRPDGDDDGQDEDGQQEDGQEEDGP